ncbi:hypothetical protein O7599_18435 [Streptomyces sp. WMMC500]|uniref:hypothetical protein n=1 Tax=Streptomyces sp. WMMC500 TaxID=3015154 RepID=UPI00248B52AC|nr:hypothetical protein [Streptomyces sp. WMMC500]WBB57667.1 hypothetical protein O7599_18435 [Streptomyces sp. WMMC500]
MEPTPSWHAPDPTPPERLSVTWREPSTAETVLLVATVLFLDAVVIAWMVFSISFSGGWLPGSTDMSESARAEAAWVGAAAIGFWALVLGVGRQWRMLAFQVVALGTATLVLWRSDFP